MFKDLIAITDTQITLAREAMLDIQGAKGSGEIDEGTANVLIATQIIMMQTSILESQVLKEVKKDG